MFLCRNPAKYIAEIDDSISYFGIAPLLAHLCLCKSMHLSFSAFLFCSFQLSLPHIQSLTMCSDRNENSVREKGGKEKKRGIGEFRPTPYHKSSGGIHACTPVYISLAPRLLFIIRNVIFDINQGRKGGRGMTHTKW